MLKPAIDHRVGRTPLGRLGQPDDFALEQEHRLVCRSNQSQKAVWTDARAEQDDADAHSARRRDGGARRAARTSASSSSRMGRTTTGRISPRSCPTAWRSSIFYHAAEHLNDAPRANTQTFGVAPEPPSRANWLTQRRVGGSLFAGADSGFLTPQRRKFRARRRRLKEGHLGSPGGSVWHRRDAVEAELHHAAVQASVGRPRRNFAAGRTSGGSPSRPRRARCSYSRNAEGCRAPLDSANPSGAGL